jgi:hypothetical protein
MFTLARNEGPSAIESNFQHRFRRVDSARRRSNLPCWYSIGDTASSKLHLTLERDAALCSEGDG